MSTSEFWTNDDGLNIRFGNEKGKSLNQGKVSTAGDVQEVIVSFTYEDLTTSDAVIGTYPGIAVPAGARIESASVYVTTPWVGGTSVALGTFVADGSGGFTVEDANGLMDATDGATANLVADAKIDDANAALVGTSVSADSYVSGKRAGTYTAGAADLVIKYRK